MSLTLMIAGKDKSALKAAAERNGRITKICKVNDVKKVVKDQKRLYLICYLSALPESYRKSITYNIMAVKTWRIEGSTKS